MRENEDFSQLTSVKRLNTLNIAEDIRDWLRQDESRTREQFIEKASISMRTLESILAYDGTGREPNWTRETSEGVMRVIGCESFYTPKHKIK